MSQNQGNNRRSGRGGQRRNRDRDGESNQDYRPRSEPAAAPEKPSFFQKILGIFKPKKAAAVSTNGQSRSGGRGNTTVTSHYPDTPPRAPREPRENRDGRDRDGRQNRDNREDREPRDNRESREPSTPRPSRKPEAVEVTTPKLYVGNLSFDASESDLSELFAGVGQVQIAEVVAHKDTERSKGFGFVTMTSVDEAKRAVTELHDKEFMGRKLVVSGAKTPIER